MRLIFQNDKSPIGPHEKGTEKFKQLFCVEFVRSRNNTENSTVVFSVLGFVVLYLIKDGYD